MKSTLFFLALTIFLSCQGQEKTIQATPQEEQPQHTVEKPATLQADYEFLENFKGGAEEEKKLRSLLEDIDSRTALSVLYNCPSVVDYLKKQKFGLEFFVEKKFENEQSESIREYAAMYLINKCTKSPDRDNVICKISSKCCKIIR